MKLLHKLLPVATIASVAAVVTPLVTSCGKKWQYSFNFKDKDYEPTVDPLESDPLDNAGATAKYFTDAAANHDILVNDLFVQISQQGMEEGMDKFEAKVDVNNVDAQKHLLSFRLYTIMAGDFGDGYEEYEMDIECKDIEFVVYGYGILKNEAEDVSWCVMTAAAQEVDPIIVLDANENWSIKGYIPNVEGSGDQTKIQIDFNKNKKPSDDDQLENLKDALGTLEIYESYYLSEVKLDYK